MDILWAELRSEMCNNVPVQSDDCSKVRIRGNAFRHLVDAIAVAVFKIQNIDNIVATMTSPYEVYFPHNIMALSNKKMAITELLWLNRRICSINTWSDNTHGNYDENDTIVSLMLGIFRMSAEWVPISLLDFLQLLGTICPLTFIDEDTAGATVLAQSKTIPLN